MISLLTVNHLAECHLEQTEAEPTFPSHPPPVSLIFTSTAGAKPPCLHNQKAFNHRQEKRLELLAGGQNNIVSPPRGLSGRE